MHTKYKSGFTLIEILIAIAIIAILGAVAVPFLRPRSTSNERTLFISRLNGLLRVAVTTAQKTGMAQRIVVDIEKHTVHLESETTKKNDKGEPIFEPTRGLAVSRTFSWPKNIKIQQLYIEGSDEMDRPGGSVARTVWFFITPAGLAQDVIINMIDSQDVTRGKPRQVGLVLNPFTAHFDEYDSFQK